MAVPVSSNPTSDATELAAFLGLKDWQRYTDLALVDQVASGLPAKTADTVARRIDPTGAFLQATDLVPKATYHRKLKENQALSLEHSQRVFALARVLTETLRQYHDDRGAALSFLRGAHPMLGRRSLLEVACQSSAGAHLALTILTRAEASIAV